MTLGEALQQLGRRDPTASYYADAVTAEKSALEVLRPDNDPRSWSQAETDLGAALSGIGMRDNSREEFQQAIDTIRAGATDEFRQREPYSWLRAESMLAMALEQLGSLEMYQESLDESNSDALDRSSREHLEEAVTTARASIPEASRDGDKIEWSYLQGMLGTSLEVIGESEEADDKYEATEHLKEAVEADRAALRVMTMKIDPENWADTENTLGDALQELGRTERNPDDLEQAIASYQEAGKVQTLDRDPAYWSATQNRIAGTYEILGMREPGAAGIAHLQQAVAAYEAASRGSTPDNDLMNWLTNQRDLARTQSELGERESGTDSLQQAAASYREELKYLSPDHSPTRWKEANEGLNNVLNLLRSRGVSG
jgi:tetratricopeptide (TPR) repeat protein